MVSAIRAISIIYTGYSQGLSLLSEKFGGPWRIFISGPLYFTKMLASGWRRGGGAISVKFRFREFFLMPLFI
jgi:hypothetical protein